MPPRKGKHRRPSRGVIGDPQVKDGFFVWVRPAPGMA